MKDTRKLSLIYFLISLVMLLIVCFGCSRYDIDYIHTVNGCDVYYIETDNSEYVEMFANNMKDHNNNFVIQSDFGIIEVQDGEIVYNNIK